LETIGVARNLFGRGHSSCGGGILDPSMTAVTPHPTHSRVLGKKIKEFGLFLLTCILGESW